MGLDGDCPECGSEEYHRLDDCVKCENCGYEYHNVS